jgi:3-deoxy-manno-octulosonate cytidylyltransferase (CMP-KDO synthetase)
MKAIAIIPARLGSTRLARKALREIAGLPMIGHVYRGVSESPLLDEVLVATDSEEILDICRKNGWHARMTSSQHRSGTERVHEISCSLPADVYLNVQGDEPLTRPEHVASLVAVMQDPAVQVGTLKTKAAATDISNPNAVKVVTDGSGRALYFSRATIPHDRDGTEPARFVSLPESFLEKSERLEQLRFLENGIPIYVGETPYDTVGVDTEEDLERVTKLLAQR